MTEFVLIERGTVICPTCNGPIFPVFDFLAVPDILLQHGVLPKDAKICYVCQLCWFLKEEKQVG